MTCGTTSLVTYSDFLETSLVAFNVLVVSF
jgi:hypothetical protein